MLVLKRASRAVTISRHKELGPNRNVSPTERVQWQAGGQRRAARNANRANDRACPLKHFSAAQREATPTKIRSASNATHVECRARGHADRVTYGVRSSSDGRFDAARHDVPNYSASLRRHPLT
jgi:hypothetical protein